MPTRKLLLFDVVMHFGAILRVGVVVVVVEEVVVGWLQPKKRRNADKASDSLCPVDVSHIQHEATFHTLKACDLGSQARVTR
jgi:hypothetical protein